MKSLLVIVAFLLSVSVFGQKKFLMTYDLKPTSNAKDAFYAGTLQKKDGLWLRELWYTSYQRSLASQTTFKDEEMKIPHGKYWSFHPNLQQESVGEYADGLKEGVWLTYDFSGQLKDSLTYAKGFLSGVQYSFHRDGSVADSSNFDGKGNGATVGWHRNGSLAHAGLWTMDTVKKGKWKYYDNDGKLLATESYELGKVNNWSCFDTNGDPIDTALCKTKEATFPGEKEGWRKFLMRNLNASAPIDNGAKAGMYTVIIEFEVEKDGTVTNLKPLTNHRYGMEQEVLRLMSRSPKWNPAYRFGRPAKFYMRQPVTFVVSEE